MVIWPKMCHQPSIWTTVGYLAQSVQPSLYMGNWWLFGPKYATKPPCRHLLVIWPKMCHQASTAVGWQKRTNPFIPSFIHSSSAVKRHQLKYQYSHVILLRVTSMESRSSWKKSFFIFLWVWCKSLKNEWMSEFLSKVDLSVFVSRRQNGISEWYNDIMVY